MPSSADKTLNVFIDESGTFDFSPKGSKYFILTAVSARGCSSIFNDYFAMKHGMAAAGLEIGDEFHATEDRQVVRNQVYELLARHCEHECFCIDSIIAQKNKVNPSIREEHVFYAKLLRILLRWIFRNHNGSGVEHINIWTARIGVRKKKNIFESTVKTYLGNDLDITIPYRLLLHASAAHPMLQVADYCCWAIAKKWKDGDLRSYEKIKSAVRTEFDAFRWGKTVYYRPEKA